MSTPIEEARLNAAAKKQMSPSKFAGPHGSYPVENKEHLEKALQFAHFAVNPQEVRQRAISIAKRDGIVPEDYQPAQESVTEAAEMPVSHDDTRAAIQRELDAEHLASKPVDDREYEYRPKPSVSDVFPKHFTFRQGWDDSKHFQRGYKMDGDGRAKLGPVSQPVFKRAVYVPADASSATTESDASFDGETLLTMPYIAVATLHEAGSRHSAEDTQHINDIHAHLGQARSHIDSAAGHVTGLGAAQNPATAYQTYGMGILTASDDETARESDLTESATGDDIAIHESGMPTLFTESSTPKKGVISMRIIQPGFNTSGKRYYTKGAIAEAHNKGIFVNRKMYIDHPTPTQEAELPERSLDRMGGHITETFLEGDGSLWGKAVIVNPKLKTMLADMQEHGILGTALGVSINATGKVREGMMEGRKTNIVEAFHQGKSVDFVTEPGAGGRVALMESSRDDAPAQESQGAMTVTPEQVQAILDELKGLRESNDTLKSDLAESNKARAEADARASVAVRVQSRLAEIAEAELPAHSKARVAAVMEGATTDERLEEAITREIAYVKQTVEHFKVASQPGRVTGLGGNANRITESSREAMAPAAVKEAQDYLIEAAGPIWDDKPEEFVKFAKSIGVL